jgi:nucleoside 2-deoxyribosyltransferase
MLKVVYLSGPITGLTYADARFTWREYAAQELTKDGITVLSPMRHEGHLAELAGTAMTDEVLNEFQKRNGNMFSHSKMIVAKDFLDIDQSSIMLANFAGAKQVSKGTQVEFGYAKKAGKPIITVMEPEGNPNDGPFTRELSDGIFSTLDEALIVVRSLLSEGV